MTIFQSILLGIIQGITEFLPISSSGHLVIVPYLLGWEFAEENMFTFNVLVQVATLIAVFAYFWGDLLTIARAYLQGLVRRQPFADIHSRLGWYMILATIPAGLMGLIFKEKIESAFTNVALTAGFLLVTAGLLILGERVGRGFLKLEDMEWKKALFMGLFQVLALFPGVSRSGSTITAGIMGHLERPAAARFSFLMSIPIMLLAGIDALFDLVRIPNLGEVLPVFIPGFIAAALTGYLAIRWLLRYLVGHSLYIFAAYCTFLGLVTLLAAYF
jgi:undecaprenyl-diphosphatase